MRPETELTDFVDPIHGVVVPEEPALLFSQKEGLSDVGGRLLGGVLHSASSCDREESQAQAEGDPLRPRRRSCRGGASVLGRRICRRGVVGAGGIGSVCVHLRLDIFGARLAGVTGFGVELLHECQWDERL